MNINVGAATCRPLLGVIGVAVCLFLASCVGSADKTQTSAGDTAAVSVVSDDTTPVIVVPDDADKQDFTEALGGGVNLDMVFVEGGTFTMGCTPEQGGGCDSDERPAHSVTVGDFSIGKYEVTQKQWSQVMGKNPSHFKGNDLPVEQVSWDDIQEFIAKLNSVSGKTYRLPTEAEWEYAARGGSKSKGFKYSGSNNVDEVAWYSDNSSRQTKPVGTKLANELGIHDMSGNVWEWVNDWYGSYEAGAVTNPQGPSSGSNRVFRGGGWYYVAKGCRVSDRRLNSPDYRDFILGFRLAVSP